MKNLFRFAFLALFSTSVFAGNAPVIWGTVNGTVSTVSIPSQICFQNGGCIGSGGMVTSVTASPPLVSSGGSSPNITATNSATGGTSNLVARDSSGNSSIRLKAYSEAVSALGNVTGATSVDLSVANVITLTLTGAATLTFTNLPTSGQIVSYTFWVTQGNGGSHAWTLPASVQWAGGGSAPSLTTTNGKTDIFSFVTSNGGTTFAGFTGGLGFGL